jgi:Ca2+/Na+ antiporter
MSSPKLIRWGGLAAMVGGVLWALSPIGEDLFGGGGHPQSPAFRPFNLLVEIMSILLIVGLLAVHFRYNRTYGRLGRAGFVVILGSYALGFIGGIPALLFPFPSGTLRDVVMIGQGLGFLSALISGVGAVLLGIALWRTRAVARLGALLLIIALPVGFPVVVALNFTRFMESAGLAFVVPYGVAWVIVGYQLWAEASAPAQRPSRAR